MMQQYRARTPRFPVPASGSNALFFGNSISDTFAGLGQWCDTLCARYGWLPQGRNQVPNGRFDVDTQGWVVPSSSAPASALVRLLATSMTGVGGITTPPAAVGGSYVGQFQPQGSETLLYASPYAPAAISQGTDTTGDAGGIRLNATAGDTYCWSCYVLVPSTQPANTVYLNLNTDAGILAQSAYAASGGGWQRLSATGAVPAGATQIYQRILMTGSTSTNYIYATGFQVERVPNPSPYTGYPTQWTNHYYRAAISGSLLENNDSAANAGGAPRGIATDGQTQYANRVTSLGTPPQIIFVLDNENDLYYTAGSGAVTPTTLTTWRTAMHTVLPAFTGMTNLPKVVVLGCSNTVYPLAGGVASFTIVGGSGYTNGQAVGAITNPTGYPAGSGFAGTLIVSGGVITGVTITTPGTGYFIGGTAALSGGTGGSLTIASLSGTAPAYGISADLTAGVMDNITRQECDLAGPNALFVPLRASLHPSLIQTGANGKHPNTTGMQAIADLVTAALEGGT